MDIEAVHTLFMQGVRIKEIASKMRVKESQIHYLIKKERQIDPDKWPVRTVSLGNHLDSGNAYIQKFHVYECPNCVLTFAVEMDYENQSDVCCPICWSEDIEDVSTGAVRIIRR